MTETNRSLQAVIDKHMHDVVQELEERYTSANGGLLGTLRFYGEIAFWRSWKSSSGRASKRKAGLAWAAAERAMVRCLDSAFKRWAERTGASKELMEKASRPGTVSLLRRNGKLVAGAISWKDDRYDGS